MTSKYRHRFLFTILLFTIPFAKVFSQASIGKLPIENFPRKVYEAQAQNWDIIQGDDRIMYIANNGGLLVYNGEKWKEIDLEGEATARTLVYYKDTIFVGGNGEFGTFTKNNVGDWKYTSYLSLLPETQPEFNDIWNVYIQDNHVLFQSHHFIFDLLPSREKIEITYSEAAIAHAFLIDDTYFIYSPERGLCDFKQGEISPLNSTPIFMDMRVNAMIKTSDDKGFLLFTSKDGIFELRKDPKIGVYSFKSFGDKTALKELELYSAIRMPNGLIAVLARGNGLFFVSEKGNVVNKVDKKTGLIDDNTLCQYVDRQGNLWVGTSNGISRIEINSTVSQYNDRYGLKGTVEGIVRFHDTLYAATQSGLYYFDNSMNRFARIESVNLECWGMDIITIEGKERLLLALNDGIYELVGDVVKPITAAYPWRFAQHPKNENEVFVGLDGGVGILNYSDSGWAFIDTVTQVVGDVFNIQNLQGKIWLGTKRNGLYELEPDGLFETMIHYDENSGLPQTAIVAAEYNGKVLFGTQEGIYMLENGIPVKNDLIRSIGIDNPESIKIHRMSTDRKGRLWLVVYNEAKKSFDIGYIQETENGPTWNNSELSVVSEETIHALYHDQNNVTWLGGVQGIFKYIPFESSVSGSSFPVYITSLRNQEHPDSSIITLDIGSNAPSQYVYDDNSLWIDFAAPSFFGTKDGKNDSHNEYSYYLEGKDATWCDWRKKTSVEYQSLSEGSYIFHVKARDFYGNLSEELTYQFQILPPWYRTIWAYLSYAIAFIIVIYIAVRLSIRRVKKQNERLEEIIEERTAEVVRQKEEIEVQKELVDEKNRDILDSIKYAERIQTAILPPQKLVEETFSDSFVLFKPKDIVSGDFYWMEVKDNAIYFAAVDCTGHGVPGAMVSVVGHNGLNRCVKEFGLTEPAKILDKLTQLVEETFEKSEDRMRDGMDISLCKVDLDSRTIEYAGANNPLWIISKNNELNTGKERVSPVLNYDGNNLFEIKPDKQPIGRYEDRKPYTNHTVRLAESDRIYLFSDGYADQFGGPKGKKFKYKPFKHLLLSTFNSAMKEQMRKIDTEFETWKRDYEQVDDVCIFGVQL